MSNQKKKRNRIRHLIERFGICTCIDLQGLFAMQELNKSKQTDTTLSHTARSTQTQKKFNEYFKKYYYNYDICSIISDYLFQISLSNDEIGNLILNDQTDNENDTNDKFKMEDKLRMRRSTLAGKIILNQQNRRSTFFPLLLEESLKNSKNSLNLSIDNESSILFENSFSIITVLNEKSVLLSKYLASGLLKYSKVILAAPAQAYDNIEKKNNRKLSSDETQIGKCFDIEQ